MKRLVIIAIVATGAALFCAAGCGSGVDPRYEEIVDLLLEYEQDPDDRDFDKLMEARDKLDDLIRDARRPKPEYHNMMGRVYILMTEMNEEAKVEFQKALEIDPRFADAHFNLGIVAKKEALVALEREDLAPAEKAEAVNRLRGAQEYFETAARLARNRPDFVRQARDIQDLTEIYDAQ